MEFRIGIVDDIAVEAQQLEIDIRTFVPDGLSCTLFDSGEAFWGAFVPNAFNLVFIDIYMDGMNGIEVARRVRQLDSHCLIVFLTTSDEFAWQAFPLHPFDYLLKPYAPDRILQVLQDAERVLGKSEIEIEVRVERRSVHIPCGSIYYAVARNYYVSVTTAEGEYRSANTFAQLQRLLAADERFLQCNRGVLINMDAVLKFEGDRILMKDGAALPVRQRDRNSLFRTYTQYHFRHMKEGRRG